MAENKLQTFEDWNKKDQFTTADVPKTTSWMNNFMSNIFDVKDFEEPKETKNSEDKEYINKLSHRESGGRKADNLTLTNQYGYKGIYQFGKAALKDVGMSEEEYLSSVNKQDEAALRLKYLNLNRLKEYIPYIGSTYKGIKVTENGLAAAAHLGGAKHVKEFFDTGKDFKDANGTPISSYLRMFS